MVNKSTIHKYQPQQFKDNDQYMIRTNREAFETRAMFVEPVDRSNNHTIFHPIASETYYNAVRLSSNGNVSILGENRKTVERTISGYLDVNEYSNIIVIVLSEDNKFGVRIFAPGIEMYTHFEEQLFIAFSISGKGNYNKSENINFHFNSQLNNRPSVNVDGQGKKLDMKYVDNWIKNTYPSLEEIVILESFDINDFNQLEIYSRRYM